MAEGNIPNFFPNYFPPVLPAVNAWMFYGLGAGVACYLGVFVLLVALGWTFLIRGWPLQWLARLRITLIVLAIIVPSVLGIEISNVG